ncbi:bifunctional 2-C-methyl-D-erythritol 4-phosphate cytidylyltransferase/2-C-methyl-D-erythritol 2,4-cyclodiphosphate synthase [Pseudophaeobacter leonis]|uniref:bifunctional 2-C-methyl-D-erythritol 4-phosphate cytidylyltransferase/2-C-methyl-D-erythritol 2,4-cyclodiphosphate synthase n=1 Tax=Pseudophaeobacter leonis TaxID=1144477 RepID=UPI0009F37170|nr:bifunctional 2-C-methyl-D-erythritol 4-phosphate cytidylyltransferase/2-C-methyl-D-erythritol 2,4-cyclodiphosphate synthase [Pseudophaeobacter leonis]
MTTAALIVAAGRGTRAGGGVPKQWRQLQGQRVIDWTLKAFRDAGVQTIALVLSPEDDAAWESFRDDRGVILTAGGGERAISVQNGLRALMGRGITKVLIHDAARPCISQALISSVIEALDTAPAAAPALAITDALWSGANDRVTGTADRNGLYAAQTPQGFQFEAILAAHAAHAEQAAVQAAHAVQAGGAADDVEVARAAGLDVTIVAGEPDNIKITRPEDFARAARILETEQTLETKEAMAINLDVRLGNGYDVHRFGPGDSVTLCGVEVPHDRSLQGHSDADVGMHAVSDAIYGALAQGDIGQHFPPSDPQWKGAASEIFLRHAANLAREMGFQISNVDCTLVCEYPKIGPHAAAMRAAMARILDIDEGRVSVKATTSERLGFTGRSEGIASIATAALVKT